MFGLHLSYIFTLLCLAIFGTAFFTVDLYLPKIRNWKSAKLFQQSKIYLDENIDNAGGLLDEGVRRGRIAHLLNPEDQETLYNYVRLQFRTNPAQALLKWSSALQNIEDLEKRSELLDKSMLTLKDDELPIQDRKVAGEVSYREINRLMQNPVWSADPDNILLFCELLAETGKAEQAQERLVELLDEYPLYPEGVFLLTRLTVHLKDNTKLIEIGRSLASLSAQRNKTGVDAIRHMTLLHLLNPLSPSSLGRCIELLRSNPDAEPIDYMRIHALQYASTTDDQKRKEIVFQCSALFDMENHKELLIFSRWLARLGEFERLIEYLPFSKARVEEDLFKLRMNALAQVGDLERIHTEVANAPLIPTLWRMVVEARAYAMQGKYEDSMDVLDRLIPLLGDDPREVRAVCLYLEASKDIRGLCHVLEKLTTQSIHARFALTKLLEHRAGSADIIELQNWLEKLAEISPDDPTLHISTLYLQLLNPQLPSPSNQLNELLEEAKSMTERTSLLHARITLALGHLRNDAPDQALVALGRPENWRQWTNTRGAWSFLASQIYRLNKDSEKAMVLSKEVNFARMDRAEKESLQALFPSQF
jgi:tetratricopeptide (TPR) repeat protein